MRRVRYNPTDNRLRKLERELEARPWDFDLKTRYNQAMVQAGRLPPPDSHLVQPWPSASKLSPEPSDFLAGHFREWREFSGDLAPYMKVWRRWFFPNGFGLSALFDATDPIVGLAPSPDAISPDRHELKLGGLIWKGADRTPYGGQSREEAVEAGSRLRQQVLAWPSPGEPPFNDHSPWGYHVLGLAHDNGESLLAALQAVSQFRHDRDEEANWDSYQNRTNRPPGW